jgi:Sulfocyanin (SoxE) domain
VLVFAVLVAVTAAAVPAIAAVQKSASRAPSRMLVYAQEWSLWPSRSSLPPGAVIVQLSNRGMDAHDLRIRRLVHGHLTGRTQGVAVTQSGGLSQATWHLSPGRYMLYCSMPGHYKKGMHTRLVVR